MNNVKTYNVRTDVNITPSVQYFTSDNTVNYKKDLKFTTDKTEAEPGDLVMSNNGRVYFTTLDYYISNGKYFYDEDGNELYPTGVVVVPASHTEDGTVRICSLKYADYNNRLGSNTHIDMYWGAYNQEIEDLTAYDYDTCQTYVPGTTTVSTGDGGLIPTDYHKVKSEANQDDPGTYWHWDRDHDGYAYIPSPYNADSTKSEIYHTEGTVLADMNGKANTEVLRAFTDDDEGYNLSGVRNLKDYGYCTAAIACLAHDPNNFEGYFNYEDGEDRGWYLPSIGELGYLVARMEKIDRVRRFFGAEPLWNMWLWSSTQFSKTYAWRLSLGENDFGNVDVNTKGGSGSVIPFAAF